MRTKLGETIKDVKKEVRKMGLEKKRLEQQIRVKSQSNPDIAVCACARALVCVSIRS
jgi:uncharacterized protein (UPF0335 family)